MILGLGHLEFGGPGTHVSRALGWSCADLWVLHDAKPPRRRDGLSCHPTLELPIAQRKSYLCTVGPKVGVTHALRVQVPKYGAYATTILQQKP